jgi:exodeoxyribonuclease V alpha subunit
VILGTNHHDLDLYNGDMGLVVRARDGGMRVVFPRAETCSVQALERLSGLEPAFAMTVHKAQGSEFDRVLLVLPEEKSPLLSRQILYTALTRARKQVRILGTDALFAHAISVREKRPGGVEIG